MEEKLATGSLLHTRIHRPKTCSDVIERVRLFERLNANLDNPLTLISAPAGYGKTTLVTSWLDHILAGADPGPFHTAWLSVNLVDNDPHTFFSALVAAIESAFPNACADIRAMLQSGQPVAPTWLTATISQACIALPSRLVLIVEDYYLITNEAVHAEMATLIRDWSLRVHTIIVTRSNPPLRLAQLRARQQLLEIRSHDLQFDRSELTTFVHGHLKNELPPSALDTLLARTEGWATGVRLATVSLQQRKDVATFIGEFERNSNRYIVDYLVDEVLEDQPAEMQTFLLHTAVLPRMSGPLCAVVAEGMNAPACQAMLEQLEQRNLFIVNLDDHRGWYRYHHQFQSLLLNRLRLEIGEAGIRDMRARAADWLASNGYTDEAIVDYAGIGDFDQAAHIIEHHLVALQNDEQWPRLSRWLSHMPEAELRQRHGLLIALGWVKRFQNADDQVAGLAAQAERLLAAADEAQQARWQAQLLALKTMGNVIPDAEERITIANQARWLAPREHIWVRTYAALRELQGNQAIGRYDSASNLIDDLLEASDFSDGKSLSRLHMAAAAVHSFEGALSAARWHAQWCRDYSLQHRMPMTAVWGSVFMGLVHFQRNELQDAEFHFRAVLDARLIANWQAIAYSAHALLCVWVEQGRMTEAQWVVDAVRELESATGNDTDRRISSALAAYLALHSGDARTALQWVRSSVADKPHSIRLSDPELPILAHILLAQNTPAGLARAQSGLTELLERKRSINDRLGYHEALVWLAQVQRAQNRPAEALDALEEAVAFGQPRGFVRWFVEGGESVREMLVQIAGAGRHAAEAQALLAEMARSQARSSPDPDNALLHTKLYKPRPSDAWVARPRLVRALDEGLSRKLILVDAPAGYGKTTLLAQWLSAQPLRSAWLSLDAADNDLGVFVSGIARAVHTIYPDSMQTTAMLLSAVRLPPVNQLANTLINELDDLPDEIILVLDDFHVIQSPEIVQIMSRLVDHPPSSLHLVLTTRVDPHLPLGKLRARGEILEIRAADLRFSSDQVREFLEHEVPQSLGANVTHMLEARTEGWPAGLRLVALSLNSAADPQSFIQAFAAGGGSHVTDFLVNEVLANLTPPTQDFLLRASLLDRFCAPLCAALGDTDGAGDAADAKALLAGIGRQNLFLVPLDSSGEWFRFHHLFRDLLRNQLQARISKEAIARLHARASDWLAAHGLQEEALQQARAAGDVDRIIALVEANAHTILNREEWMTLSRWLALVPQAMMEQRPKLLMAQVYVKFLRNERADIPSLLDQVDLALENSRSELSEDEMGAVRSEIEVMLYQSTISAGLRGDASAEVAFERALRLLPTTHRYVRGLAIMGLAMSMQMHGRKNEAEERLRMASAQMSSLDGFSVRVLFSQWVLKWFAAEVSAAGAVTERYLVATEEAGLLVSICWAHAFAGMRHHEMNNLSAAAEHFEIVVAHAHHCNFLAQVIARMDLMLAHQASGQPDLADAVLKDLRAHAKATQTFADWRLFDSIEARLHLLRGNLAGAMRWARSPSPLGGAEALSVSELPSLTRAQILIAQRSSDMLDEAMSLLQVLRERAQLSHYHGVSAKVMAVQASALYVLNRHDAALEVMTQAADIGERGGLIRTFADLGPDVLTVMRALAQATPAGSRRHDYLTRVIAAFGCAPAADVQLIEPASLTLRECEILELLDKHRSDKEIAEALVLSRLTVSKHTANIYRKLGVGNRREAVKKAHALGLLPRVA